MLPKDWLAVGLTVLIYFKKAETFFSQNHEKGELFLAFFPVIMCLLKIKKSVRMRARTHKSFL